MEPTNNKSETVSDVAEQQAPNRPTPQPKPQPNQTSRVVQPVRLCQFEENKCQQRCHKNYRFCFKHILSDKEAPFKQCVFIVTTKNKSYPCPTAIAASSVQPYCNKHQYELGLKEKKKAKRPAPSKASSNATNQSNAIKPIPKKHRLTYSNDRPKPRALLQFAKKSSAYDYCYADSFMDLLYMSVFSDEKAGSEASYEKIYQEYLDRSIRSQLSRNAKIKKTLNYCSKNVNKLITQMKSTSEHIKLAYNLGKNCGENKKNQCIAKITDSDCSNGNKIFKCTNKAVVGSNYCIQHFKVNKKQVLFNFCKFKIGADKEVCGYPVVGKKLKKNRNIYCSLHQNKAAGKVKPPRPKPSQQSSNEAKSQPPTTFGSTKKPSLPQLTKYQADAVIAEKVGDLCLQNQKILPPINVINPLTAPKVGLNESNDKNHLSFALKSQPCAINIANAARNDNKHLITGNNPTSIQQMLQNTYSRTLPNSSNNFAHPLRVGALNSEIVAHNQLSNLTYNHVISKHPFQNSRFISPIDLATLDRTATQLNKPNLPETVFVSPQNIALNPNFPSNFIPPANQPVNHSNIYANSNRIQSANDPRNNNNSTNLFPFVKNPNSGGPPNGFC